MIAAERQMVVLDASAALEVLLKTPRGLRAMAQVLGPDSELHAPYLLDIEFANALRRMARSGAIDRTAALQALNDLLDLHVLRCPHEVLLRRIWALRDSLSAYDAVYVALSEMLDAPLLTCDAKLARSHGHRARIVLFE